MAAGETVEAPSLKASLIPAIVTLICIGLSQLLAWLAAGKVDGFLDPLTTMQSVALISMIINLLVFVPAYIYQTEKFYDLTGSITYLTCTWYSFVAGSYDSASNTLVYSVRSLVVSCMVTVWALRLGYFLFRRVLRDGKDGRFDDIKPKFYLYLMTWALQGLWVFLTAFCAFIINTSQQPAEFLVTDYIGFAVWLICFGIEVVADHQKSAWRAKPENKGKFIDVGLWYYSRHPNYFGEVTLWLGIFIIASGFLVDTQWVAVIAPIFEFCLIYFVSGVNKLEKRSDEKFGALEDYKEYKRTTNVFFIVPKGWTCGIQTVVQSPA